MGPENRVRRLLQEDRVALGIVCRTLSPVVVELVGLCGFDFVWIDMEHTGAGFADVENLCRAAGASGIEALVRVPDKAPSNVVRALEVGAAIVNVPMVENAAEAEAAVKAARYPPEGDRGFCSSSRGNRYGLGGAPSAIFAAANERVMTMVQIESKPGVESAPRICQVVGLDAIFIGVADLSLSLGIAGQFDHPELLSHVARVVESAKANAKTLAVLVENAEAAQKWVEQGARILCCGVDIVLIRDRLSEIGKAFDGIRWAGRS